VLCQVSINQQKDDRSIEELCDYKAFDTEGSLIADCVLADPLYERGDNHLQYHINHDDYNCDANG